MQLIRKLYSLQIRMALVTGSSRNEADLALNIFQINKCFERIISADDTVKGKPDPEPYIKAARLLNVSPKTCIAIEDSPSGLVSAYNAGVHLVALTTTHSPEELAVADTVTEIDLLEAVIFNLINNPTRANST